MHVDGKNIVEVMNNAVKEIKEKDFTITCAGNECEVGKPIFDPERKINNKKITYPPFTNGWQESVWNHSSSYGSFAKAWNVPSAPQINNNQLIYLFIGKEPNGSEIIQPVLSWNYASSGTWQIASWYVYTGGGTHSQLLNVNVGDNIYGWMTLNALGNWFIGTSDITQNIGTGMGISDNSPMAWNIEALETYGVTACNQYSGTALFTPYNANLPPITTLDWSPQQSQTGCNLGITIRYTSGWDYVYLSSG